MKKINISNNIIEFPSPCEDKLQWFTKSTLLLVTSFRPLAGISRNEMLKEANGDSGMFPSPRGDKLQSGAQPIPALSGVFPSPRGNKLQYLQRQNLRRNSMFPSPCGDKLQLNDPNATLIFK